MDKNKEGVAIQLLLDAEQNKKVELYKALHHLATKAEAIAKMIDATEINIKV